MSRSRKKTPFVKQNFKYAKRRANKKVRYYKGELPDGKWYRKLYCSWDICDWIYQGWDDKKAYRK